MSMIFQTKELKLLAVLQISCKVDGFKHAVQPFKRNKDMICLNRYVL